MIVQSEKGEEVLQLAVFGAVGLLLLVVGLLLDLEHHHQGG